MRILFVRLVSLMALLLPVSAYSHHSFSAEFDVGRPVEVSGTVTKMEWTNPHAWMHLTTEDEDGNVQNWAIEMLGINTLVRRGMTPKTVKAGDMLTVTGFGSRDGSNTANASSVTRTQSGETLWSSAR